MDSGRHHIFLALNRPRAGRWDEFNRWYDEHHLIDVVTVCPGFVRGRRFLASPDQPGGAAPRWVCLALYDVETDDVAALHAGVSANVHRFTPSNGVFDDDHVAWVYTPTAPPTIGVDRSAVSAPGRRRLLMFGQGEISTDVLTGAGGFFHARAYRLHADQRPGVVAPWAHLTMADVDDDGAASARRHADQAGAAACWLYDPVGRETSQAGG